MKYEYSIKQITETQDYEVIYNLNKLGNDGWELVTVIGNKYLLKRTILLVDNLNSASNSSDNTTITLLPQG